MGNHRRGYCWLGGADCGKLTCGSDFTKLSDLQKELDEKNDLLLEKYERYEYLSKLEG